MNDKYIRLFKEEDETLGISLCDQALGFLQIIEDFASDADAVLENVNGLRDVLLQLKANETSEQSRRPGWLAKRNLA